MYASRPAEFTYHRATSVDEAVRLLGELDDARVLAGGHSLLPAMKIRLSTPAALVDIGGISGLDGIEQDGDGIRVGALARHADVAASDLVRRACPALADAAGLIGDRQVRNRGTIGGSLAHADPGADYPAAVTALGATVIATGRGGEREIPAGDFFTGLFATALEPDALITAVRVPAAAASAYVKHPHPASGYAVVGAAAVVSNGRERVVIGGAAPVPVPVEALGDSAIGDTYASADYRRHLAGVLAKRALARAAERAA